jgi:primosomal protein N' (replication factor Y) (superfamily II helicase)
VASRRWCFCPKSRSPRNGSTVSAIDSASSPRPGIPSSAIGNGRSTGSAWHAVAGNRAPVVVGARSALFLPYADLGLIVVDEEHDQAFKQEDGVSYHARDMAVVRGSLGGFPVVLSSATPSLETVVNAETGRYGRAVLTMRHGAAELPRIGAIDLRCDPPPAGRWLSPVLEQAIKTTLAGGEQAMLFLNRRGYAPLTLCRACGHRMQCPNCTAWLVEHRFERRLQCHHCGYKTALPMECPSCHAERSLQPCGPGVERVAEEAAELFPAARTLIVASDTIPGPAAAAEMIRQIAEREVDLVIGTQIVAKGHHFPMLTLVGVIDADLGLSGGDLRAAERTWQLLAQVAGRAGRAERPGQVLLQSYAPEQPVIAALVAGDRDAFLEREQAARRAAGMPPFGRLAALIIAGRDGDAVVQTGRALARAAPRGPDIQVLGPAPAPLAMLRGRHRHRLLLKAERGVNVSAVVREWLGKLKLPGSVRIQIDIDPYSFL